MTAAADRPREVSVAGEAIPSGFHYRRVGASRRPHDPWTFPAAIDSLSLDVLRSDSPIQRGERIVYRGDEMLVEYRVVSVRSRRQDDEYWNAVLAERVGDAPIVDLGGHPEPEIERGVDAGEKVAPSDDGVPHGSRSELELLCDIYSPGAAENDFPLFVKPDFPQGAESPDLPRERGIEASSALGGEERIVS